MGVISSTACGTDGEAIKAEIVRRRASSRDLLVERFRRARADGDMDDGPAPEALCEYLFTLVQGIAVQAGAGTSREELDGIVETSLAVWPTR